MVCNTAKMHWDRLTRLLNKIKNLISRVTGSQGLSGNLYSETLPGRSEHKPNQISHRLSCRRKSSRTGVSRLCLTTSKHF